MQQLRSEHNFRVDIDNRSVDYINLHLVQGSLQEKIGSRTSARRSSLEDADPQPEQLKSIVSRFGENLLFRGLGLAMVSFLPILLLFGGPPNSTQRSIAIAVGFVGPAAIIFPFACATLLKDLRKSRNIRKDRLNLADRERFEIQRATETLMLGGVLSSEELSFTPENCACGDLIRTADGLCRRIVDADAWSSEYLRSQRAQFDPGAERTAIINATIDLHSSEQYLGPRPQGDGTSALLATREWDFTVEVLADVWTGLRDRIAGLESLAHAVTSLDQELAHSSTASRAEEIARHAMPLAVGYELESLGSDGSRNHARHVTAVTSAIRELVEHSSDRTEAVKSLAPRRAESHPNRRRDG
ncbi:hypothetical protein ACFO5K_12520 [Nocardia halotolerans]|uniref:Uncharacterized protein n=1 Tax=Nocardia halotolerans TaxID=1755878 RepID=A0ABV8VFW4_9NOCA